MSQWYALLHYQALISGIAMEIPHDKLACTGNMAAEMPDCQPLAYILVRLDIATNLNPPPPCRHCGHYAHAHSTMRAYFRLSRYVQTTEKIFLAHVHEYAYQRQYHGYTVVTVPIWKLTLSFGDRVARYLLMIRGVALSTMSMTEHSPWPAGMPSVGPPEML